jgi:sugar phosphate isomerase/epimerase
MIFDNKCGRRSAPDTSARIILMSTRRQFAKTILAAPAAIALGAVNSRFDGVQIGTITYSFRTLPADRILDAVVSAGLSEVELMSNHAEALLGAPAGGRGSEAQEALARWRTSVSMDKFKQLREKFDEAGVDIQILCYNLRKGVSDDEIEYSFQMAKALGARAISSTAQISTARRVAPFADKHKMMWGAHGHDRTDDPEEFSTPESFATVMSFGKYMGVNLDIGHFTAANYDAVAYIRERHDRITNLHLKDRKKNHGANLPWGEGDTPIKPVLQLLKRQKYLFPANIEYEYMGKDDPVTEVKRCVQFCKEALAS